MKKFDFKTRMQWGWFKAALFGTAIAILIAPAAGSKLGIGNSNKIDDKEENPIISMISSISLGPRIKIMINGNVVALAKSEEAAEEAYKEARLAYNAKGVKILDADVTYAEVDKEKDAEAVKGKHVLRNDKLTEAVLEGLNQCRDTNKELAYTMRIDDYTVTVENMEDLVSILEQAQGKYDVEDSFQVGLKPPASRNVTMYEVAVAEKEKSASGREKNVEGKAGSSNKTDAEEGTKEQEKVPAGEEETVNGTETAAEAAKTTEKSIDEGMVWPIEKKERRLLTGAETQTGETEKSKEDEASSAETENSVAEEQETEALSEVKEETLPQAADDGVKYVGFAEKIQVMETYVDKSQIKNKDTAYNEITQKNAEASIYVVEQGDCLSIIAEKNNMTVEEIKELNPGIESDDNLYYDDRLNITIPTAAVQVLVEKQETYKEEYSEDTVYEDDNSMYIGETEVVQEGKSGTHTVTDLVTYKDDLECGREQLQETVEVAAIAQVVRRGTKSKPTYMFPVTNWNVTSNFGYRWGRLHAGTDVGVPIGTTVRASRGGQVLTAGWLGGYGNCVIIDHGDGVCTYYGHLSETTVAVGQYVDQGQQIALSGNTGRSTGPHLHFEIRINGEPVDPLPYLYQTQ